PAASRSESHVTGDVPKLEYPATVAVPGVPGAETRVHTPAPDGFKARNGQPDSILSSEPKPLVQHRPPPPQSVLSPDGLSYPP
nr:hypothetical protein [Tanacetum cinerariifolium]